MAYRERLPIPEGMTKDDVEKMKVIEGNWRESPGFICRACKNSAYYHPHTNAIWGCKKCGYTTYSVNICFMPRDLT